MDEDKILNELYGMALTMQQNPANKFYEGRYSGAVAIAMYVISLEKINEIEKRANESAERDEERTAERAEYDERAQERAEERWGTKHTNLQNTRDD